MTTVLALAAVLTIAPIKSTGTFQLAGMSVIPRSADTLPGHWVAVLMLARTLTDLTTVQAVGSRNTSLIAAVAGKSRRASTLASDVITRCSWRAVAEL